MRGVEIEWKEPPPPRGGHTDWSKVAAVLRAYPNKWARILRGKGNSMCDDIKHGKNKAFLPHGHWEATWRQTEAATAERKYPVGDTYVRYIGPTSEMER